MKGLKMKKYIMIAIFIPVLLNAAHLHKEAWYQDIFCTAMKGQKEYRLPDRTRVDCLTEEYAIEVDFATKWAEGIGQALYYGYRTNKKPGVLLITEQGKDYKYVKRLQVVAEKEGIVIWLIDGEGRFGLSYQP